MTLKLHPVFLKKSNSEFVVLPFDEYTALQELLSDYQDLLELGMAKQEEEAAASVSLGIVKAELGL